MISAWLWSLQENRNLIYLIPTAPGMAEKVDDDCYIELLKR